VTGNGSHGFELLMLVHIHTLAHTGTPHKRSSQKLYQNLYSHYKKTARKTFEQTKNLIYSDKQDNFFSTFFVNKNYIKVA